MNFNETCEAIKSMSAKWPQAVAKFVEDKANGPAVMNALSSQIVGLIPIEPEGSKYARVSAVSPLAWSGNVQLPSTRIAPWVENFLQEALSFPSGANDDQLDAFSQAVNRLLLMPILNQGQIIEPDIYDDYNAQGWSISPY
jgi:predicted phage terminase large subunit-like protein